MLTGFATPSHAQTLRAVRRMQQRHSPRLAHAQLDLEHDHAAPQPLAACVKSAVVPLTSTSSKEQVASPI